jgi:hypothetical protein
MPRGGAETFSRHQAKVEERRAGGDFLKADYFSLEDGEYAIVRFLEQGTDLAWAPVHRVKVPTSQYPQEYVCLDENSDGTPCPFCQSSDKEMRARHTKGYVNLIWRGGPELAEYNRQVAAYNQQIVVQAQAVGQQPDISKMQPQFKLGPVLKRNDFGGPEKGPNGEVIILGFADAVWLWKCSKTVFDQLLDNDKRWRGLMSRDFVVSRRGSGMKDTKYSIEPVNPDVGAQPMSQADQVLVANRFKVDDHIKPKSYDDAAAVLAGIAYAGAAPATNFTRTIPLPLPGQDAFSGPPVRSSAFGAVAQQPPPQQPVPLPLPVPLPAAHPVVAQPVPVPFVLPLPPQQ